MSATPSASAGANKALTIGIVGLLATILGVFVSGGKTVAFSYLVGMIFWIGMSLGMLFLIMIHHIFDASWSVILRRQYEHALSALPKLFILFLPLVILAWVKPDLLWKWMDPNFDLGRVGGHGMVGQDPLWFKKSGFLNPVFFTGFTVFAFGLWSLLANRFRNNSFNQDKDGNADWTRSSRKWAAAGIPLTALTLTAGVILWVKSLDYHWFSTMYGVWFFAGCVRAALSAGVLIMIYLWKRGDYKGILNNNHMHSIGMLMFAFTVFWAYVTFSQYFLIWNANIPEETFWYNIREINNSNGMPNQWKWVGMFLLFGHFFFPFFALISYPAKVSKCWMKFMGFFIATVFLIDLIFNIMPSMKTETGDPYPFISSSLIWIITAVIGIGGVCISSYLRSFATTKLIPIRDPRITECLTHHE